MFLPKFVCSLLVASLPFLTIPRFAPPVTESRPALKTAYPQAVLVLSNEGRCSGSVIRKNVVLTAAHCVDDLGPKENNSVTVQFTNGQKPAKFIVAYVGTRLTGNDIALLKGDTGKIEPWTVANEAPEIPDNFFYVSSRDGQQALPALVIKAAFEQGGLVLEMFSNTWPGDSGSPLLDSQMRVIGVVFASSLFYSQAGYSTGFDVINDALAEMDKPRPQELPSPEPSPNMSPPAE